MTHNLLEKTKIQNIKYMIHKLYSQRGPRSPLLLGMQSSHLQHVSTKFLLDSLLIRQLAAQRMWKMQTDSAVWVIYFKIYI